MYDEPLGRLLDDLGGYAGDRDADGPVDSKGRRTDVVFGTTEGRYEIGPSEFTPISLDFEPRRMAFVDGGNGLLAEAPDYLISLNRIYSVIFRGERREQLAHTKDRIEFFSCVVPRVRAGPPKEILYDTRIYAHDHDEEISEYLPEPDILLSVRDSEASVLRGASPLASLARRLSEIRLATMVLRKELGRGDMLVMDGSLQASFGAEKRYASRLYKEAEDRGVIVCGLAKTTRLITESGAPLLARVAEIARDVAYERWYVPIAKKITEGGMGFLLAVRLHPSSRFLFRLEILRSQFTGMSAAERDAVMCSLALNAGDVSMLGYPYGAIVADKFAQVRMHEAAMYRRLLLSRQLGDPAWRRLASHSDSILAHEVLNRVTG